MAPTDAELAIAAAGGQRSAWSLIWQRHSRVVRRFLARHVHHEDNADDLLQETFAILYTTIGRIQRPEALRAFLFGIAARVATAARLKRRRRTRHILLTNDGNLPEWATRNERPPLELESALARLPKPYGDALVLRHMRGFDLQEIAVRLDISPSSAHRWLARAERRLERLMRA